MKVKELIEELQKQNPDSELEISESNYGRFKVRKGEVEITGNPASCSIPVRIIVGK